MTVLRESCGQTIIEQKRHVIHAGKMEHLNRYLLNLHSSQTSTFGLPSGRQLKYLLKVYALTQIAGATSDSEMSIAISRSWGEDTYTIITAIIHDDVFHSIFHDMMTMCL